VADANLAAEERHDPTVEARRNARYHYARQRVQRIVNGMPPLSVKQRQELASMLAPFGSAPVDREVGT
jgi:hypothetical protein